MVHRDDDAGFTLLEVLIALVLTGLAVATLAAGFRTAPAASQVRPQLARVAADLDLARASAIMGHRTVNVLFDLASRSYRIEGCAPVVLAPGIGLAVSGGLGSRLAPRLEFHDDGSSSGIVLALSAGGRGLQLRVDWLTGAIVAEAAP